MAYALCASNLDRLAGARYIRIHLPLNEIQSFTCKNTCKK